ncbi:MAG: glycosyltransferase family 1 protein [Anaerolineae bacterium]|nr:glycosyltransferase family 4 protein [Anaerolineae bacterium]MDW8102176.1 glycosyltransferase family 1 protein [Anaerolineae bacterium]
MRVHLFADSPWENWPSMDRYARSLFRALKEVAPGVDFRLLVPPDPPSGLRGRFFVLWRMLAYPLWARRYSVADVYHILDHSYGHLLFALDGSRTIVTVHDIAPLFFPGRRWGLSQIAWETAWKGCRQARWLVAVSEFTRRELMARINGSPDKIITIYNGVEAHFRPLSEGERALWREKWKLGNRKLILHVGHCQPRKNLEGLLAALALLANRKTDFLFIQTGGAFSPAQQRLIDGLGLKDRVFQIKRISEEELIGLYNSADVVVLPSLYEGFGLPALEAMACGTPVVASSVASLPEVVGDAGLLVDPRDPQAIADAIDRVLSDPALAEELRRRGLERAKGFTWEKTAREAMAVYLRILEGNL